AVFAGWETTVAVTLISNLSGQTMQLNKALSRSLVEGIPGVVGSQGEVVQRRWRATSIDNDLTSVQNQTNVSGDVLLRFGDERIQRTLQRGVPQTVVDFFRPASISKTLVAC